MEVQKEYLKSGKRQKNQLLDEVVKRTGMNRKYVIRRLSAKTNWEKPPKIYSARAPEYSSDLIAPLVCLWDIFDEPCGQRLEPLIKSELEKLRKFEEIWINDQQAEKLKKMSAKTIDRLLNHEKSVRIIEAKYQKGNNPLLYQKIPTKLSDEFDRNMIGQIQIDGVEHCGQNTFGQYLNTIAHTDVGSGWWEAKTVLGKGKEKTLQAIKDCRARSPFAWKEIHPDNGTSFINYFLYDYAKQTKLEFSRSRPFKKNDNCFVEQKNSRNVRRHMGHVRYDTNKELLIINDLYEYELRLYKNFFQPIMRLETKERGKGHIYRKYHKATTPYQWLMENENTPKAAKERLKKEYDNLNPAELKRTIENKLQLLSLAYQTKHGKANTVEIMNNSKVTFSFDPTAEFRLPALTT